MMGRVIPHAMAAVLAAVALPAAALARPGRPVPRPALEHAADGRLGDWRGEPTHLAGRWQVSRGELIYTDYLYDDYGPDYDGRSASPAFRASLAPAYGDYRYPDDAARYGHNAADLRELRLAVDADSLHVLVGLQTMKAANATAVAIALDTDGDARTGASRWPDGAGVQSRGADRFVTLWGTGGHVVDSGGRTRQVRVAVDLAENAMEAEVPLSALGPLSEEARVWVGTGLARAGGGGFAPQDGPAALFNVGFRGDDDWPRLTSLWGEHEQSQALARGDVTELSGRLRLDDLRRGRSVHFQPPPGFYNRIFRSRHDFGGEGVTLKPDTLGGTPEPTFLGRWQPYGLYIPRGYDPRRPAPLLLDGHSLDVNHNQYRAFAPRQLEQLGDDRGSLVFTPLARGSDTWYLEAGLVDVLEAWQDLRTHYAVDDERTSVTGYSMGGYMTYRLGLLMPDRFARASVYAGPPAYSLWAHPAPPRAEREEWVLPGNTNLLVENALNLPFEIVHGNADELVPVAGVVEQAQDFRRAGNEVRFHRHLGDDHFSFIFADHWEHTREWLGNARVDRNPERVRFRRYPAMDLPRYGLRFDRAYWVSDIEVRDASHPDDFGRVDVTTRGRGGGEKRAEVEEGLDPQPAGTTAATVMRQRLVAVRELPRANAFEAALSNVRGLRLDLPRMGLDARRELSGALEGDGMVRLRLGGRFPRGVRARLDGTPVRLYRRRGETRAWLALEPGRRHVLRIGR